jgi:hypothetical protein
MDDPNDPKTYTYELVYEQAGKLITKTYPHEGKEQAEADYLDLPPMTVHYKALWQIWHEPTYGEQLMQVHRTKEATW